jgi:hypothetical protein
VSVEPIRIGISSGLLGEAVRHDGSHRHNGYITDTLGRYFLFVPYCPEVPSAWACRGRRFASCSSAAERAPGA